MTAELATPGLLDVFIPGIPKPQGSMRAFKAGGHISVVHGNGGELGVWRTAVTTGVAAAWGDQPPLDEPVAILATFHLPRPKSIPKRRRWPDRLPDLDKLVRAVLDSMTGVAIADDARVVSIIARKHYATERPAGLHLMLSPVMAP
jgi:Holliday junction resolvase RusA-like endonuclease